MKKVYFVLVLVVLYFCGCAKSESNNDQTKNSNIKINTDVCCVIDIPEYSVVYALTPEGELNRYNEKKQYEKFIKAINGDTEFRAIGKGVKIKEKYCADNRLGILFFTNGWLVYVTDKEIVLNTWATQKCELEIKMKEKEYIGEWRTASECKGIIGILIIENEESDYKDLKYVKVYIKEKNKYKLVLDGATISKEEYKKKYDEIINSGKEWVRVILYCPDWLDIPLENLKFLENGFF